MIASPDVMKLAADPEVKAALARLRREATTLASDPAVKMALARQSAATAEIEALIAVRDQLNRLISVSKEIERLCGQVGDAVARPWAGDHELLQQAREAVLDTGCSLDEVRSRSRTAIVTAARWRVIRALRNHGHSLQKIGAFVGRDHGAVLYALQHGQPYRSFQK